MCDFSPKTQAPMRALVSVATFVVGVSLAVLPLQRMDAQPRGTIAIVISTDRGDIGALLDSARAPVTVTNFLRYIDAGLFSGGQFHRTVTPENQPRDTVRIEVIQGRGRITQPDSGFAAIPLERTSVTGLQHLDGTLSMARAGANTARSAFFITIGNQPSLNEGGTRNPDRQGFAAFGRVTSGMEIVRAIQRAPHAEQNLTPPVMIRSIRRAPAR
jgi:peptidyl-prolyl cis-trans isomerase A (cyclophilin A)